MSEIPIPVHRAQEADVSHAVDRRLPQIALPIILFILAALSCSLPSQVTSGQLPSSPAGQTSTIAASTTLAVQPAAQDTPGLPRLAVAAPTRPSQPTVVNHYCIKPDCSGYTYPGDFLKGLMGGINGVFLVLPVQIWTAAYPQGIYEWDSRDGHLMNTVPLTLDKGNFTDIQYDGKQLWADQDIPLSPTESSKVLYIIDPRQAGLIKKITHQYDNAQEDHSYNFGISPGEVWLEHRWITSDTFQINDANHYFACGDSQYAYDGQGHMWVTGAADPTFGCGQELYVWNAADPAGQPLPSDGADNFDGSPLVLANGKMWMIANNAVKTSAGWSHPWLLTAFNLNDPVKPAFQIDISQYMPELNGNLVMAADNKVIWIASDAIKGNIDYYDQGDGHHMGSLQVGQLIEDMGFDGTSLWVMDNEHGLEQIALPWGG